MPEFNLALFIFGCVGGLLPDALRLIRNRHEYRLPTYLKKANFWIGVVLLVALGGITAWLLEAETAKDALIYGFASPQLLSQLVAGLQSGERVERGAEEAMVAEKPFKLFDWWRS